MLFQRLDNKKDCATFYIEDKFAEDVPYESLTKTWSYAPSLEACVNAEYANLFCHGKSLEEACPDYLLSYWHAITSKFKAYMRSFREAKVDLNDVCFYDLVPEGFLLEYCEIRNRITKHVFENYERPENYDFLLDLVKLTNKIENQDLNIDLNFLNKNMALSKVRRFRKKVHTLDPRIKYNIFGSKTGRLTTKKNSFPIHTLDKRLRSVLKPNNDLFLELDFNAAELRTLLALHGRPQPKEDFHEWINKNVFGNSLTRDATKQKVFAWLYNPESENKELNSILDKTEILKKFYANNEINTPYGRTIAADDHHALNYLIQSTTSDMFLRRMIEIDQLLASRKSYVSFCIHDSLILDLSLEDKGIIHDIIKTFSETEMGTFKTNISVGKDFGNMGALYI